MSPLIMCGISMRSIYLDIPGFSLIYIKRVGNKKLLYKKGASLCP